nr:hypothetical protein [Lachnospiraceae bacterium]
GSWYSDTANDSAAEAAKSAWSLTQATYYEGFLILHTDGAMPEDPGELSYEIKRMDADGTETIVAEGALGKVLTQTEPVTLDITALDLPAGTYTLTIEGERVEFTVTAD